MANEIYPVAAPTGLSLRAVITQSGYVWSVTTGAWVALASATFANSLVTLTESGATGIYGGDLPSGLSSAYGYGVLLYKSTATGFDANSTDFIGEGAIEPSQAPLTPPYTGTLPADDLPDGVFEPIPSLENVTAAEVILQARGLIADEVATYRWGDAKLLGFVGDALCECRRVRPDLFFDNGAIADALIPGSLSDALQFGFEQRSGLAHYVAWRALSEDGADTSNREQAKSCRQVFDLMLAQ